MEAATSRPLSGRRAEAARNDQLILAAAREVFIADPGAPIAAVAERAGVGIGALYRRYRSKDELLRRLATDNLRAYVDDVEVALSDDGDPWDAFCRFMHRRVAAGTSSLTVRFAGSFTADEELQRLGRHAFEVTQRLIDRTQAAGALRPDITFGDLTLLFEQLQAVQIGDPARADELRLRYLALMLDGLRAPRLGAAPRLTPDWKELSGRYTRAETGKG